jgi:hypothetical protein
MSIGSLGIVGGMAATPLSQRAAETDRAERDSADQARQLKSNVQAEAAAGIGQTEEDAETSERDADGRRPWEIPGGQHDSAEKQQTDAASPSLAKDPTGATGGELDLVG